MAGKVYCTIYEYNVMGNMLSVTDLNGHKTSYKRDKNNQVVLTENWNGTSETRSYDDLGQLTATKVTKGSTVLDSHSYKYGSNGNLIDKDGQKYQYDSANRLSSGLTSYTLDNVGNITSAGSTKMTYDNDSRLTSIDDQKTTSDADGNLTDYTIGGKTHKAVYNSQNQLTNFDGTTYQYDANGNRVKQNNTSYVYDDSGNLLSDSDNTYIYGTTGLIGYYDNANNFHTNVYDNRGDVVKVLDNQGNVSGTISYGDYGNVVKTTGTIVKTPFKYAGQYGAVTDDNGLVYLKTRYYNPQLMRFMNRDTVAGSITDSQSLNRFSYVEGNPLTYVDLNGQARTWLSDHFDILGGLGWDGLEMIPILGNAMSVVDLIGDLARGESALAISMDVLGIFGGGEIKGLGKSLELLSHLKLSSFSRISDSVLRRFGQQYEYVGIGALDNVTETSSKDLIMFSNQDKEVSKSTTSTPKRKPYSNPKRRPKYAKGQVESVWNKAVAESPDGIVRDPHTLEELTWDKTKSRKGQWDMGHKEGLEYRKLHKQYMDNDIDKKTFLEEYRNPDNYVPENIHANRSHKYEEK